MSMWLLNVNKQLTYTVRTDSCVQMNGSVLMLVLLYTKATSSSIDISHRSSRQRAVAG